MMKEPATSAMRLTVPLLPLKSPVRPSAPTGTMTRLGMVWPAEKLRLEAVGWVLPLA